MNEPSDRPREQLPYGVRENRLTNGSDVDSQPHENVVVMGIGGPDGFETVVAGSIGRILETGRTARIGATHPFVPGVVELAPGMSLTVKLPAVRYQVKRGIDIVISGLALLVLLPVLAVIAVLVKVSSPGPVFFRQSRVGRRGDFFEVLKFRSMQVGAHDWLLPDLDMRLLYEANDFKVPSSLDPRITTLGRLLRRTSLDELPQLINVFLGHMSMVGPRPVVPDELTRYGPLVPAYLAVRPGITGAWQVGGRSKVNYPERAVMDFAYVVRWGLLLDFTILLRTIPAVLSRKGAY
jgi:lipopolysaccharide/colanic/teichoic acid biosynthesis glycosyltransferase